MAALMAAKHDYELKADSHTHLHLDHRHMGVGGDDSWSPSLHRVRALRPSRQHADWSSKESEVISSKRASVESFWVPSHQFCRLQEVPMQTVTGLAEPLEAHVEKGTSACFLSCQSV